MKKFCLPEEELLPCYTQHRAAAQTSGTWLPDTLHGIKNGIELELIKREGIPYHPISAEVCDAILTGKHNRPVPNRCRVFPVSIIMAKLRPHIVYSKGGFVSCPVVWAAWCLRRPVIIHESDITPGLANRLSSPFAEKICYSFPETGRFIPSGKGVHTGLPVRKTLLGGDANEGRRLCGFQDDKPVLMVIGGSQGSLVVNAILRSSLADLVKTYNICHLCGKGNLGDTLPGYAQFEYVNDELPHLFSLADLVISRSGATTLFELLSLHKPNLLIPLATNASRGDQILNAESFAKQGFSRVLPQNDLTPSTLVSSIDKAFTEREEMRAAMEKSSVGDGVEAVIEVIRGIVN